MKYEVLLNGGPPAPDTVADPHLLDLVRAQEIGRPDDPDVEAGGLQPFDEIEPVLPSNGSMRVHRRRLPRGLLHAVFLDGGGDALLLKARARRAASRTPLRLYSTDSARRIIRRQPPKCPA